jgi:hypothetical protein
MKEDFVPESHWSLSSGLDVNVHRSEMEDCHVEMSFIGLNSQFSTDMTIDDVLGLRDELTRICTDIMRVDQTIQCPACGYTWSDATFHNDHRNCRRYPFFPDESGQSYAK